MDDGDNRATMISEGARRRAVIPSAAVRKGAAAGCPLTGQGAMRVGCVGGAGAAARRAWLRVPPRGAGPEGAAAGQGAMAGKRRRPPPFLTDREVCVGGKGLCRH